MEIRYFIKNLETWLYFDYYRADNFEAPLKDITNCIFKTEEEAMKYIEEKQDDFSQKYITIEKIILNL